MTMLQKVSAFNSNQFERLTIIISMVQNYFQNCI